MKLAIISSLALAAAMLVAPSVMAQDTMAAPTMIGQQTVSADDLPKVQAQCATLAGVEGGSLLEDGTKSDSNTSDSTSAEKTEPNAADAAAATIHLDLITIEECKAAGLAK